MEIIQTLTGAICAVGFAVLFNVHGKKLWLLFLGGALDWIVYLVCMRWGGGIFVSMLLATATAALSSEILARIVHAPVLLLMVPMLIPLVPGGDLYHTMRALILADKESLMVYSQKTLLQAAAIALGIIAVSSFMHVLQVLREYLKEEKAKESNRKTMK